MVTAKDSGTYIELDDGWDEPGWTRVPNGIARCKTISRRLKGWILEVASHEKGRRITVTDMVAASTDGRDATYATIKEGIAAGFITRRQERDESGRVGVVVYRLHQTPQKPRSEPLPGLPDTAGPDTANPETSKKTSKDLKDQRSKDMSADADVRPDGDLFADADPLVQAGVQPTVDQPGEYATGPRRRGSRTKIPRDDLDRLFEEFWGVYAHKVAKGTARKAWTTACGKADPTSIIAAAAQYATTRDHRFVAHPATWLNGERWADEASNGAGPGGDYQSVKAWLLEQHHQGRVRDVEDRSGLRYPRPTLPDEITTPGQAQAFHAEQVRAWIKTNHETIIQRVLDRESRGAAAS